MNNNVFIHKTAIIEEGVKFGSNTKIWDNAHIRKNTQIGKDCIIGGKAYIAYGVKIGDLVKINSFAYICAGVTIKDKVMISAGTIFTNDRFPRAVRGSSEKLYTSEPTDETEETLVDTGATIGAGAIIGCGITLGKYCMVGMGSIVTKSIPPYALVYGTPSEIKGYVCECGYPLTINRDSAGCSHCKSKYAALKKNNIFSIKKKD